MRLPEHVMGLPVLANERERYKILLGNRLMKAGNRWMKAASSVANVCRLHGVPFTVENLANAYLWSALPFAQLSLRRIMPNLITDFLHVAHTVEATHEADWRVVRPLAARQTLPRAWRLLRALGDPAPAVGGTACRRSALDPYR